MPEPNENPNPENNEKPEEKEDVAGLKSALEKEREARKAAEKSSKALETKLAAIESSGKTESEKLAARLEALEKDNQDKSKAIQERDAKDQVRDLAKKAGAPDVDLIYRVVRGDIEFNADGDPTNLKTLIDDLKQMTPNLFKPTTGKVDGGSGNGSKPQSEGMNALIRRAAGVAE